MAIYVREDYINPSRNERETLTPVEINGNNLVNESHMTIGRNERILVDTMSEAMSMLNLGYRHTITREAWEHEKKRQKSVY